MRRAALLLALAAVASCSSSPDAPAAGAQLSGDAVARVGGLDVPAAIVGRIAAAQGTDVRKARDVAVREALFAAGAIDRGLDRSLAVKGAVKGRLARAALEKVRDEARATPPTDQEVAEATAEHFYDFDRPPSARTTHAVAMFPKGADAAARARTRAVAELVARAVAGVRDPAEFRKRAEAVPHEGIDVRVEDLNPVAPDGRNVTPFPSGTLVLAYADAATRLANPGDQSGLVETEFGLHVIMLVEKLPEHRVPFEERRAALRDEIWTARARDRRKELLEGLRARERVEIERSYDTLLREMLAAP